MKTDRNEHREWTDLLSDYIEGGLSHDDHQSVELHLGECGACRRVLEELRAVIARAAALGEIQPPRDLWQGIAATIQAPVPTARPEAKVIALPTAGEAPVSDVGYGSGTSRVTLTRRQLLAASVALIAASSLVTWVAGPGLGVRSGVAPTASVPTGAATLVSDPGVPVPRGVAEELEALEATLAAAREALDPNTVRVLERNLAVIERAIEDSRRALAQDPGNEFLAQHLDRVYQRKLDYMRDAARVAEWAG